MESYRKVKQEYFPDPGDKTEANFDDCVQLICTDLYSQPHPGDHLKPYIQTRAKHSLCFDKDGVCTRPDDFYSRLLCLSRIGDNLFHNLAGNSLFTKGEFKLVMWSTFSNEQTDWLVYDQNMDPHDADNPFDAKELCWQMLRHSMFPLQNKRKNPSDNNSKKGNENDKKGNGNNNHSPGKGKATGTCPIPGHAKKHPHYWGKCQLNPNSKNFDKNRAKKYLQDVASAKGSSIAWHRDIMKQKRNKGNFHSNFNQEMEYLSEGRGGGQAITMVMDEVSKDVDAVTEVAVDAEEVITPALVLTKGRQEINSSSKPQRWSSTPKFLLTGDLQGHPKEGFSISTRVPRLELPCRAV